MNKNQLAYAQYQLKAKTYSETIDLIKHIVSVLAGLGAIWLFFNGLSSVLAGRGAEEIGAFATVIHELGMDRVLLGLYGAGATFAWRRERAGKKRAIKEKSGLQKELESKDSYRSSSGLTVNGDTPKGEN